MTSDRVLARSRKLSRLRWVVLAWLLVLGVGVARAEPAAPDVPDKEREVLAPALPTKLPEAFDKENPADLADLKAIQEHVEKLVQKVTPAVVGIQMGGASGSGVIVSKDGYVLTAGHVSGRPDRDCVVILPDGKRLKAKSLGNNSRIDSGLIKITEEGEFPYLETGKSEDLKVGQWVLALGHPKGFDKERRPVVRLGRVLQANKNVVTTDCVLVGGDSGGPLFDMAGNVVAIHSRIGLAITMNMHVPVDTYRETWDRLVKSEAFNDRSLGNAWMGVRRDNNAQDCRVASVDKNGPAEKAGLKEGDIIKKFGDSAIKDFEELIAEVGKKKPGDKVRLEIVRDGTSMKLEITLGKKES